MRGGPDRDILDRHLLDRVRAEFEISVVFHLAALLSTRAEFVPESAHEVNVQGTLNLLHLAVEEARALGHPVKSNGGLFPGREHLSSGVRRAAFVKIGRSHGVIR
jgi:nucleoside-diphosphate-sugar epimerase